MFLKICLSKVRMNGYFGIASLLLNQEDRWNASQFATVGWG